MEKNKETPTAVTDGVCKNNCGYIGHLPQLNNGENKLRIHITKDKKVLWEKVK